MATDPYNIPLKIFRNREWVQTITIANMDVSQDALALVVIPTLSSGGANTIISDNRPVVSSGSGNATFVFTDAETGQLTAAGNYSWQYLRQPAGSTGKSDVVVAGPLYVLDSVPFPMD
jgi:hypothetical protein